MYFYGPMNRFLLLFLLFINYSTSSGQNIAIDTSLNFSRSSSDNLSPAWSPDSKKLVYQSNRTGNWDIFLYDLEKDTTIQLTCSRQNEQHPKWHPNRNLIVFDAERDSSQYLYKINLETREVSPLFERKVICKQVSISSDGRMIYFLGYDEQHKNWELFSYHFIYDNLNQLTNVKENGLFTDLSTDGKSVCYNYRSQIYPFNRLQIFNWYGNEKEQFDAFNISQAVWHPGGLKIYFISDKDNLEGELYSFWKDGSHLMRLTDDDFKMCDVSVSPDGTNIASSVLMSGNYEIMIIPIESF